MKRSALLHANKEADETCGANGSAQLLAADTNTIRKAAK
jgi:hypothetical protein